jgi:M6 family metalloprotease-like protein
LLVPLLALAALVLTPGVVSAQSGFHPRWERPGFDFSPNGGWRAKARRVADQRRAMLRGRDFRALNAPALAGPLAAAQLTGTMFVPIVLFHYQDTPPAAARDTAEYSALLWGTTPPVGRPYTLRGYYEELSNGLFSMQGRTLGWVQLDSNEVTYTGQVGTCSGNGPYCNGLYSSDAVRRMQNGLREALAAVDGDIDFGQFDNDGPDGMPNTADDDGFVDMMAFAHATQDGACGSNNHIWAHRYVLANATQSAFQDYVSSDPATSGGFIRVRDYFIQSGLGGDRACDTGQIMPIGTAAHEFGHALGLPDLYDTQGSTEGIGRWGLMGSGNYSSANSPARMEAWSLNELGWVTIVPLTVAATHAFGPAAAGDTAFYVEPTGSNPRNEYFLLENRQRVGADTALIQDACQVWYQSGSPPLCPGGLLIWHIDGAKVVSGGATNSINFGSIHGVRLEEADGARDLWCPGPGMGATVCNRGDAGDPFPGLTGNTAFLFATMSSARKNVDSSHAGFAVDQITQVVPHGELSFRLRFGGLSVVRGSDTTALIRVDGTPFTVFRDILDEGVTYEVAADAVQTSGDGRRRFSFVDWSDGGAAVHDITGTLAGDTIVATFDREFKLIASASPGGTVQSTPSLDLTGTFVAEGNAVTVTASAHGDSIFVRWTGDTVTPGASVTLPMGRPYTITAQFVARPVKADVVTQILYGSSPLTGEQLVYLDQLGNDSGVFDVGDFLAWLELNAAPAPPAAGPKEQE